jgi:hypothetical protein
MLAKLGRRILSALGRPEEVMARSPRGAGTVAVVVTTPGGTSAKGKPDRFSYMAGKGT